MKICRAIVRVFSFLFLGVLLAGPQVLQAGEAASCLNLAGIWQGYLYLVNHGTQGVTALIQQSGCTIAISTMTSLPYGKYFTGIYTDYDDLQIIDRETDEIWTTYKEPAVPDHLELYDYVNNFTGLDRLVLDRKVIMGDVNGNAVITLVDAMLSLQIVAGIQPEQHVFAMSDINSDTRIGIEEVLYILNHIATGQ